MLNNSTCTRIYLSKKFHPVRSYSALYVYLILGKNDSLYAYSTLYVYSIFGKFGNLYVYWNVDILVAQHNLSFDAVSIDE